MGRKSTIDLLPVEVLEQLQAWLRDKSLNQDQITERSNDLLDELGVNQTISRSAVNRYAQKMEKVGAKLRQSREISQMWIAKLGNQPQGKMGALQNEMLRGIIFDLMMKLQESEIEEEDIPELVKILNKLALTQQRLEQASTINEKREEAIVKKERVRAAHELTKIENNGEELSGVDLIKRIRETVYNIYDD